MKNNIQTKYFSNGKKISEGYLIDGKKNYVWTYWYENGNKKMEGHWKLIYFLFWFPIWQRRHGITTMWHPNGQKKEEGNYINGKMDGLWIMWDQSGNVIRKEIFKNGKVVINLI
tara:strand:- start:1458 stop:1799 length:342 start_codon:yes stop_codon:yes gene_type:complete